MNHAVYYTVPDILAEQLVSYDLYQSKYFSPNGKWYYAIDDAIEATKEWLKSKDVRKALIMEPDKYRRCPFCGSDKITTQIGIDNYRTFCMGCRASTRWFNDELDSIAAWNTREQGV